MKANPKLIVTSLAAMLITTGFSEAEIRIVTTRKVAPVEDWNAKDRRYQAELRAEANAPGMPRADYRRMKAALAAKKAREDQAIALYQQYKFEQKLALAEASAPKYYVFNDGSMTPSAFFRGGSSGGYQPAAYGQMRSPSSGKSREVRSYVTVPRRLSSYPASFARRMAQEEGLDRQDARLDAQQRSEDIRAMLSTSPFGQPVPGMPGYITSPPSQFRGYIDVRGYSPGTEVTDPYTGETVRVP